MTDGNRHQDEAYAGTQSAYASPSADPAEGTTASGSSGAGSSGAGSSGAGSSGADEARNVDSINTEAVNDEPAGPMTPEPTSSEPTGGVHPDTTLAAERLADLQRLQAEYVNYKRRVDRDRVVQADRAVDGVLSALMPVLDDIHAARVHGDLDGGPFAAIADKLDGILAKFGFTSYGEVGEAFDPIVHEALMRAEWDAENPDLPSDATATTVVTVLQPGYKAGERVLRPARVAVADPE